MNGMSILPPAQGGWTRAGMGALEQIASCTASHLQKGGYMTDTEASEILANYRKHLEGDPAENAPRDFLAFTAGHQAQRHSVSPDGEVTRMQRLLRHRLHNQVHYWSLGPLPGRPGSLYEHCQALRIACRLLGCPAVISGEPSIVHLASLNPLAAVVAADWIRQELVSVGHGDAPFIFSFIVDLPTWETLRQRHFES
jgi:hypothetical protein